ncbi:MAG: PIN domain-containing protein [Burkholderiaceae bacterium]
MKTNFVLIDYENVQPEIMASLMAEHFKVIVFVGANQTKIPFETVEALQRMGSQAEYVRISGNGSNALDFHIAFYIGQLATQNQDAFFHIVSKDKGFDPLIQHLKSKKIFSARSNDISEIPAIKALVAKSPSQRLDLALSKLKGMAARPRTAKTLKSTLSALFQKKASDSELDSLIDALQEKGHVTVKDAKVSYSKL